MKSFNILICAACFLLCSAKCTKQKMDSNGLPPATQSGKMTFGFLWNGQPWTPKGFNGTSNLSMWYDPADGSFNLTAYRIIDGTGKIQQLTLNGDSIYSPIRIELPSPRFGTILLDRVSSCIYRYPDSTVQLTGGYFEFTKLDKTNGIFSGTFELKFQNTGCADVVVTEGRFDMKL